MADEQPNEEKVQVKEPKKGKGKIMLFSGVGLAVVIGSAFLFATFAIPSAPADGAETGPDGAADVSGSQEDSLGPVLIFDVPVIMVNVKDTQKKRIFKIHLNLVYESDDPEAAAAIFENKKPEMKDALTTLLTEKTLEDLESKEDLNLLRLELLDELNRVVFPIGGGLIKKIYYEEFIVQ